MRGTIGISWCGRIGELALAYHMLGHRQESWTAYRETLSLVTEARNPPGSPPPWSWFRRLSHLRGGMPRPLVHGRGRSAQGRDRCHGRADVQPQVDAIEVARKQIGEAAVDVALADGAAMTLDEAIEYARSLSQSAGPQTSSVRADI